MSKTWKIELRENCKTCGGALPNARFRTYCSKKCRIKAYNTEYQRIKKAEKISNSLSTCADSNSVLE